MSFEASYAEVFARLAMLGQLADMPDIPDELSSVVDRYMKTRSTEISKSFQAFLDTATLLTKRFNDLPDEEKEKRDSLVDAVQGLSYLSEEVLPIEEGGLKLPINEMPAFAEKLQENLTVLQYIKLNWLNDALLFSSK